jgi:hypothetical protein
LCWSALSGFVPQEFLVNQQHVARQGSLAVMEGHDEMYYEESLAEYLAVDTGSNDVQLTVSPE